jgi:hypothetical protein
MWRGFSMHLNLKDVINGSILIETRGFELGCRVLNAPPPNTQESPDDERHECNSWNPNCDPFCSRQMDGEFWALVRPIPAIVRRRSDRITIPKPIIEWEESSWPPWTHQTDSNRMPLVRLSMCIDSTSECKNGVMGKLSRLWRIQFPMVVTK